MQKKKRGGTFDLEQLGADALHAAVAVEPRGADLEHDGPDHRLRA
jgi:hypothetical protein